MAFGRPDEIIRIEWLLTARDLASGQIAKAQKDVLTSLKRVAKETNVLDRQRRAIAENERRAAKAAEAARLAELQQLQQLINRYRDLASRSRNLSHAQREEYKALRETVAVGIQRIQQLERERLAAIRAESPLRRLAQIEEEIAERARESALAQEALTRVIKNRTDQEIKLGEAAEAQANKLRNLIREQEKRIGMTADEVKVIKNLEKQYIALGGALDDLGDRALRTDNIFRRFSHRIAQVTQALDQSTREMVIFSRTMRIISIAGVIATLGGFAETLSTLAGGISLVASGLAPLTASIAALPGLLAAVGQGMLVWKNAIYNLDKAFEAGFLKSTEDFNRALEDLSVHARYFARTVRSELFPLFKQLRAEAQKELFPSLEQGLRGALTQRNRNTITSFNRITSDIFGNTIAQVGNLLGFQQTAERIERIAANSTDAMRKLSGAVIPLVDAFLRLSEAAKPAIDYVAELGVRFAKWFDNLIKAKSESGELVKFFLDMKKTAEVLIDLVKNFFGGLVNIIEQAQPFAFAIFRDLDRAAQNFREWTDSAKSQNTIKKYFEDIRGPLYEVAYIAKDIFKFFINLASLPGLEEQLRKTRQELGPALGEVFRNLTLAFGPKFTDLIISVAKLLAVLTHQSGPLTNLVSVIARMFDVIRQFVVSHPMVAKMAFYIGALASALRLFRFTAQMTGITLLLRTLRNLFVVLSNIKNLGAASMLSRIASAVSSAGFVGLLAGGARRQNYTVGAGGTQQSTGANIRGAIVSGFRSGALPVAIVSIASGLIGTFGRALGLPEQVSSTISNVGLGAGAGFLLTGSPWGALAGAISGLVLSFLRGKSAADRVAAAFERAKSAVDEHTDAVRQENEARKRAGEIGNRIVGVDLAIASARESKRQFVEEMRRQGYSYREIYNMTAYKQIEYDINNLLRERKALERELAAARREAANAEKRQADAIKESVSAVRETISIYKGIVSGINARGKGYEKVVNDLIYALRTQANQFRNAGKGALADWTDQIANFIEKTREIPKQVPVFIDVDYSSLDESLNRINAILRKLDALSRMSLGLGLPAGARDALKVLMTGATGGWVPGPRVAADIVPALLSPGEFVLTESGQRLVEMMAGPGAMDYIAKNQLPHFAAGGYVTAKELSLYRPIEPGGSTVGPSPGSFPSGGSGGSGGGKQGPKKRKILTPAQIGSVARKAGFFNRDLVEAIAVALAESGGNVYAHALTSMEDSRGLWQINVYAHPWAKNLYNPLANAKAAFRISGGGRNWNPWTVWKTGAYKKFWKAAERGAKRASGGTLDGIDAPDVEYIRQFAPGELFAQTQEAIMAGFQAGLQGESFISLLPGIISNVSFGDVGGGGGRGKGKVKPYGGKIIGTPYKGTHTLGNWQSDNAIDIAGRIGQPIFVVESGKVGRKSYGGPGSSRYGGWGVYVHGKRDWFYKHLKKVFKETGDRVKRGDILGTMGAGNGVPHLHLAVNKGRPHYFRRGGAVGKNGFVSFRTGGSVPGLGAVTGAAGSAADTRFANQLIAFGNYLSGLSYNMLVKLMNRLKRMVEQAARAAVAASGTRAAARLRRQLERLRSALDLVASAVGNAIGKMVAAIERSITNINNQLQYALNEISIAGGQLYGPEAQSLIASAIQQLSAEEQRLREALAMAEAAGNQELIDQLTQQLWDVVFQIQALRQQYVDNAQAAADAAAQAQEEAAAAAMEAAQAAADAQQAAADAAVEAWNKLQEQAAKLTDRISNQLAILEATFAIGGIADTPEAMRRKAAFLIERMIPAIVNQIRTAGGSIFSEVLELFSQLNIPVPTSPPAAAQGMKVKRGGQFILVGEGGYDEYILTTDPRYRSKQLALLHEYLGRITEIDGGGRIIDEVFVNRQRRRRWSWIQELIAMILESLKETGKIDWDAIKLWFESLKKDGFAKGGVIAASSISSSAATAPVSYSTALSYVPRFQTGGVAKAAEDPCKGTPEGTKVKRKKSSKECGGCGEKLAWGGWCWNKGDKGPFTKWLEYHGISWERFKNNNPLAALYLEGKADSPYKSGGEGGGGGGTTGGGAGSQVPPGGGVPDVSGITPSTSGGGGGGGGGGVVSSGGGLERTEIDIAGLNAQLAQTLAEIAELLKQAVLGDAARFVEDASHATRMEQLAYEGLQIQQRLAGNFDDVASKIARRDFILNQIIPRLQDELNALIQQQVAAQQQGDRALAQQIAEAIASKQNEILQAQLDAQEQTAQNTSDTANALRDLSGSLAFSYGGQMFTDLLGTGVGT